MSELSRRSNVAIATIKHYLRVGLLPKGESTSPGKAQYDTSHLERLKLIRSLVGPAKQPIAKVRAVLSEMDDPPESRFALMSAVTQAVSRPTGASADQVARGRELLRELGWEVPGDSPEIGDLGEAVSAMQIAQLRLIPGGLHHYARTMEELAELEIDTVPVQSREAAVKQTLLCAILIEPLLVSLHRLALRHVAARRLSDTAKFREANELGEYGKRS